MPAAVGDAAPFSAPAASLDLLEDPLPDVGHHRIAQVLAADDPRPFALEVCAGSARLSASLCRVGFRAFGIDYAANKDVPEGEVIEIDLTSEHAEELLMRLVGHPRLAYVHFAPPCGTASRARERRIAGMAGGGPPPLRSTLFPEGLPDLESRLPRAARKVKAANLIYMLIAKIAALLTSRGIPWSLENPHDSLFWYLKYILRLLSDGVGDVFFHNCMHGGDRDKRTRLRCFPVAAFAGLAADCDRSHVHRPWGFDKVSGEFSTALERVYPRLLCDRLAAAARAAAAAAGSLFVDVDVHGTPSASTTSEVDRSRLRIKEAAAAQPRGHGSLHVVPMHKCSRVIVVPARFSALLDDVLGKVLVEDLSIGTEVLPKGCKIVQVDASGGAGPAVERVPPSRLSFAAWREAGFPEEGSVDIGRHHRCRVSGRVFPASRWANPFKVNELGRARCIARFARLLAESPDLLGHLHELEGSRVVCHCAADEDCHGDVLIQKFKELAVSEGRLSVTVLFPWSTSEFVEQALKAQHPFSKIVCDPAIWRAAFLRASRGPKAFGDLRLRELAKWSLRAKELEERELALHATLHPDVRGAVCGKRLLLLREMLDEARFSAAAQVFDSMVHGFDVVGPVPASGVFPAFRRHASSSVQGLRSEAAAARNALRSSKPPSDDTDLVEAVYSETLDEVGRGWLKGPFESSTLDLRYEWWLPARRFGIRQGDKLRAIDDYSCFGHNETAATEERIDVGGIDNVLAMARCLMEMAGMDTPTLMEDGEQIRGPRAPDLEGSELVGKVWDLSKAYRQLPRHPRQAHLTIVAVYNPRLRRWEFFEQTALPFGATPSVYHFNLVARGLQTILTRVFAVCCSHYFDDYPAVEFTALASNTQFVVDRVLGLLGWQTKEQLPFGPRFEPLGVVVDLSRSAAGVVTVTNKASRVDELAAAVASATASGCISPQEARSLRGRFVFARAQIFGRCGAPALKLLGVVAESRRTHQREVAVAILALKRLLDLILISPPRRVAAALPPPLVLFVDGACDPGSLAEGLPNVGVGACLFDAVTGSVEYFGAQAGRALVQVWASRPDQQVIAQAELVPVLIAISVWAARMSGRPLLIFIDNDAARFGLISGYSPILSSAAIISAVWSALARLGCAAWFARVPTVCNPADGPSRGDSAELRALKGSAEVPMVFSGRAGEPMWEAVADCLRGEALAVDACQ